ncbi:hypothetical protein TI05_16665, partial [Achromatium sp. WMS3]
MLNLWEQSESDQEPQGEIKSWERELVEKVVTASVTENRRARRWKVFFQFITILYLTLITVLLLAEEIKEFWIKSNPHSSLVSIEGIISADSKASADKIIKGLRKAFKDP